MTLLTRTLAIVGLGAVVGGIDSWRRPVALEAKPPQPTSSQNPGAPSTDSGSSAAMTAPATDPGVLGLEITLAQAKKLWDEGIPFVDARRDDEWPAGVVSGAHLINVANFNSEKSRETLQFIDPARPVVIYCGGGDCHDSHNLAILFQQGGYTQVHIMTDGYPAWKTAGYDTVTPPAAEGR